MNQYYTYAYLREDGTPYYIGKGKGNRAYKKDRREFNPPKDKSRILILKKNLTEEEAFRHEIYMIAVFGRKDLGTGILHNKTDGGDGSSGAVRSEETRDKISISKSGENNPKSIYWKINFADGRIITQCGLSNWAKENSYDSSSIHKVFRGKLKHHKDIVAVEKLAHYPCSRVVFAL